MSLNQILKWIIGSLLAIGLFLTGCIAFFSFPVSPCQVNARFCEGYSSSDVSVHYEAAVAYQKEIDRIIYRDLETKISDAQNRLSAVDKFKSGQMYVDLNNEISDLTTMQDKLLAVKKTLSNHLEQYKKGFIKAEELEGHLNEKRLFVASILPNTSGGMQQATTPKSGE